jgi:hypothetical protein
MRAVLAAQTMGLLDEPPRPPTAHVTEPGSITRPREDHAITAEAAAGPALAGTQPLYWAFLMRPENAGGSETIQQLELTSTTS